MSEIAMLVGVGVAGIAVLTVALVATYRTGRKRGRNLVIGYTTGLIAFFGCLALFEVFPADVTDGFELFFARVTITTGVGGLIATFLLLELIGLLVERRRGSELTRPGETHAFWMPWLAVVLTFWSVAAVWATDLSWYVAIPFATFPAVSVAVYYHRRHPSPWRKLLVFLSLMPLAAAVASQSWISMPR